MREGVGAWRTLEACKRAAAAPQHPGRGCWGGGGGKQGRHGRRAAAREQVQAQVQQVQASCRGRDAAGWRAIMSSPEWG